MRRSLGVVVAAVLAGCPSQQGPEGPTGPMGAVGARGEAGAMGVRGEKGDKGDKGDPGEPGQVLVLDGGVVTGPRGPVGPAGDSVRVVLVAPGTLCARGGVQLLVDGGTVDAGVVCAGEVGPQGPAGPMGAVGPAGPAGAMGPAGAVGAPGPSGAMGPMGAMGPVGPMGAPGVAGPAGPPGPQGAPGAQGVAGPVGPAGPPSTLTQTTVPPGDAFCPFGGTRLSTDAGTTYACNGAPGVGGNVVVGGLDAGFVPLVFAGFTPQTVAGNLGGRTGAHGLCAAAFAGSHFCTDWEFEVTNAPATPPAGGAWIDLGNDDADTRNYRPGYSTSSLSTCSGWTSADPAQRPDGFNLGSGRVLQPTGAVASTFVATNNGGCSVPRPLTCCVGGSAVRFRGYTPLLVGGNLGGRIGANVLCSSAYPRSHLCTDWEYDQAAVTQPPPATGAWIDPGSNAVNSRRIRGAYSLSSLSTCSGWTSADPAQRPDGFNLGSGRVVNALGGIASTFVGTGNGGCGVARPLACCE
jgi:hypothetical protein